MAPSVYLGNMMRLPAFMKIGEIIMLMIVITIVEASHDMKLILYENLTTHLSSFTYGIVIGYLIVYLILLACYLDGETDTQRSKFELLLNVVGFILFLSLSIKLFVIASNLKIPHESLSSYRTHTIVVGVFTLLISACQLLDTFFNLCLSGN